MPPAGAAHGQGQIALSLALIARQQRQEEMRQILEKGPKGRIRLDIGTHRRVAACERAQLLAVMRIGEEAHIEDQIGFPRQAVAIGKGHHGDCQTGAAVQREMPLHQPLQIADGEIGAVDHQIGGIGQILQQQPLLADAVGDGPVEGQRMASARLGEAALQHLVGAGEEDQADALPRLRLQALDTLQQGRGTEAPGAAVDAERHGAVEVRWGVEQSQRQIVHRLIA